MSTKSLEERQNEMRARMTGGNQAGKRAIPTSTPKVVVERIEVSSDPPIEEPRIMRTRHGTEISRVDLYRLVWSEPMTKVAVRFGVSDVAVAKACRNHAIPMPGRGYWACIAAGQKLPKTELSPSSERSDLISFCPPEPKEDPLPVTSSLDVPIPATTSSLHPIAQETHRVLREQAKEPRKSYGTDWGRTWSRQGLLNIRVTSDEVDRAARIASALLAAAETQGFTVKVGEGPRYRPGKEVQIVVEGVPLTLEIFEPVRQKSHTPTPAEQREIARGRSYAVPRYDFLSTGKLQLKISSPRGSTTWRDRPDHQLEGLLGAVIENMLTLSRTEQERLKEEAIEERRRIEAERRRLEEENRIKRLNEQLQMWKKVGEVRAYADAVEASFVSRIGQCDPESEIGKWIGWIRNYARRIDPTGRDDIGREEERW